MRAVDFLNDRIAENPDIGTFFANARRKPGRRIPIQVCSLVDGRRVPFRASVGEYEVAPAGSSEMVDGDGLRWIAATIVLDDDGNALRAEPAMGNDFELPMRRAAAVLAALVALAWSSPAFAQAPRYEIQTTVVEDAAALALVPCAAGVQNGENEERLQRDTQELYHCSELTVGGGFDWRLVTGDSGAGGLTDESVPFVASGAFAENAGLTWDGTHLSASMVMTGELESLTASPANLNIRSGTNILHRIGVQIPFRTKADYAGLARATVGGDLGLGPTGFMSLRGDSVSAFVTVSTVTDGDVLIVDASGNVGINTLSPAVRLEVTGDAEVNGVLIVTSAEGACKFHGRFTVAPAPITACDSYWDIVAKDLFHWDGVAWAP